MTRFPHAQFEAFYRAASKAHSRLAMKERDAVVRAGPDALDCFYEKRRRQNAAYDTRVERLTKEFFGERK